MPKYKVVRWQLDTQEGEPFEARTLKEAQALVLEGQGLKVEKVRKEEEG